MNMHDEAGVLPEHNPNLAWAEVFVDELARCGLQDVCIAPGSRSTPLTLAFFAHPDIRIHSHLDERSAGFFGLGMALAEDRPIGLLCTSGTAGANFFPAIIEANMSQVPLLVLTADRPPELRHSGANQTIDQVKMFGDHVLWSVDVALPEKDPPQIALRGLRTLAARALAATDGIRKGPVHLNLPFRKPLSPQSAEKWMASGRLTAAESRSDGQPFTKMERGRIRPSEDQIDFLAELISRKREGIIICGPRCPAGDFPAAVGRLAEVCGYPIFADPLSGLRFSPQVSNAPICGGYETFLRFPLKIPRPELVLYFGAVPTSKRLNQYLAGCEAADHVHVRDNGVWADENHRTSRYLQANAADLCLALENKLVEPRASSWLEAWQQLEAYCWSELSQGMDRFEFDGAYVADLMALLPAGSALLAGNSLPVRHVDQFARPSEKFVRVHANRGASGIDGNISTGLGIAANGRCPTTILTGDITFYHDSNGLLALRKMKQEGVTLVVLNNDGGGIFRRLPVAQFEPPFTELFQAAHGLELSSIARTYDLDYHRPRSRKEMQALFSVQPQQTNARLIEIRTDAAQDNLKREELESLVGQKLAAPWT